MSSLVIVAWLLTPGAALAGPPEELVGLFIQGCMPFVGAPAALRDWALHIGLQAVPEPARAAFLHGAPGQAFDGSTPDTKLVLISSDDGLCSAATDRVTRQQVTDALQSGFHQAGLDFRLVIERDDPKEGAIQDREYLASRNQRGWRILAATVKDDTGGAAMLTAAPE